MENARDSRRDILTTRGAITHKQALEKAHREYEKYKQRQVDSLSMVEQHFIESIKTLDNIGYAIKNKIEIVSHQLI